MGDGVQTRIWTYLWIASLLLCFADGSSAQIRYSVPEEVKEGTIVGNLAKDLGLDVSSLVNRRLRIVSGPKQALFEANQDNGVLSVQRKIDREEENSPVGTVVITVNATDSDLGSNGDVEYAFVKTMKRKVYDIFQIDSITGEIRVKATDLGQPPQSSDKSLKVLVADVNDNSPEFSQNPLELYLLENNSPGELIFSVSATDRDLNENAAVIYSIIRRDGIQNGIASFVNVNAENGQIRALKSFDFEKVKTFQFHVLAADSGTPSLSSNVTVNVFILDQNDNVPVILYPVSANGSAEGVEEIPRNVNAGHLVTKVRAYDADIGYNGWLLFSLQEVSDHSLFGLDRYTGQIRTLRPFTETDEAEHKLVVLVKDNGNISLSASATLIIKLVEPKEAFAVFDVKNSVNEDGENNVIFYLIITLGSVSFLFIVSIVVLIVMQCSKSTDYSSKYLQETNYDGTLCHSIQYRSGDKRYMLVGPRTSIGSTLVPGSSRNTLVVADRRRKTSFEIRYSIAEESTHGSAVGNIAKDLGLDVNRLTERKFRIVSGSKDGILQINQDNGVLFVSGNIDREQLCAKSNACTVNLKTVAENPLEIHYIEVEIADINDNPPVFPVREKHLEISENAVPQSTRLPLDAARDLDAGVNSLHKYILSPNNHFELDVKTREEDKIPFLILKKQLDREEKSQLNLTLTAYDGGKPERFGSLNITITVVDVNDNAPVFDRQAEAHDPNIVSYLNINSEDGIAYIYALKRFDYESIKTFQFHIVASDSGTPSLSSNVAVNVFILDQNDNVPVILYPISANGSTEGVEEIPRNVNAGHLVAKVRAYDADIGYNGWLLFSLQEVSDHSLFGLDRYTGQIRTLRLFTESDDAEHKLVILVKDNGNISLFSNSDCDHKTCGA
ncbi:hypothetical protein QTP86_003856 [Hemibagrus guttatus]|nr:hypothetical protein QTP86_003856 [Hemibagrus guttatus]